MDARIVSDRHRPVSPKLRSRLEAQGFCGLDDATLEEIGPWLRWSPALCTLLMLLGVGLESPPLLWGLAVVALLGAWLPFHPFDLLYNHVVRHFTGTRALPHQGPQRRFACGLAAAWLAGTGWAFHAGAPTVGFAQGIALICVAALVSITHFCIPSFLYNTALRAWRR